MPDGLGPRKRPRQQRSAATVSAILQAAAELLAATGYARTSTNQIAARAGVSVGSLYQYFPNKDAVVAALLAHHHEAIDRLIESTMDGLRDASVPVRLTMRGMLVALGELHGDHPGLDRAIEQAALHSAELDGIFRRREHRFRDQLEAVLRERPDVRRGPHALMAALLGDMVETVSRSLMHGPGREFERRAALDEATEAICRYLDP